MGLDSLDQSSAQVQSATTTTSNRKARATSRSRYGKGKTAASVASTGQNQEDETASNTPQPKSNARRIRIKGVKGPGTDDITPATSDAATAPEDGTDASTTAPKRSLKVTLSRRVAPAAAPKAASPPKALRDELRALASEDSDDEDAAPAVRAQPSVRSQVKDQDEEALPAKRVRKRSRRAAEGDAFIDSEDESEDASTASKRKRPAQAAPGAAKKKQASEDDSAEDSDVVMSDPVSESDLEPAGDAKKAQKPKKATPATSNRTTGKAQGQAADKKKKAAPARKPSQAELAKMMASKGIRASAAATATASPKPGQVGTPNRPMGAVGSANRPGMPGQPGARKPMPVKPRGSDMWDSLVGGSSKPTPASTPAKPTPAPTPSASDKDKLKPKVKPEGDKGAEREAGEVTDKQGSRLAPAINLPRPLGIAREGATASPASREHGHHHGAHRHDHHRDQSSIVVHMTPGLNGQHWDKEAYRQQRLREKQANRAPEPETLIDLLADAEVVMGFEEEWRQVRVNSAGKGSHGTGYPSLRAREYGAGLALAKTLKEARQRKEERERKPAMAHA